MLVIALYLYGNTKPPQEKTADAPSLSGTMQGTASHAVTVDFEKLVVKAKATLTDIQKDSIEALQLSLLKVRGNSEKALLLQSIGNAWTRTGNIIVGGKYFEDAAEINNEKKTWEEAANRLFMGFPTTSDSLAKIYGAQEAAKCYHQLAILDSDNMDYPVKEAICYVDGLGQVMQGVLLLKDVENKEPDNKYMNLILGRLAVLSGQYDKAVTRLEKLVSVDPKNSEAYFHLAEAYRALGRKSEAIKAFESCKSLVNSADFDAQIDNYIKQIKNS